MEIERTFNFYGLAGLRVRTSDQRAAAYFEAEYGAAAGSLRHDTPVVELRWTRSRLPRRPAANYRLKIHKGLARWYYRVELQEGQVQIVAAGNSTALPMVHHMLVHGALRYLVSYRDALLLHASGVAHAGRSLLFAGSGGVGKTTVSSLVLDGGGADWEILADDYVFVTSEGTSLAYPARAHLYADILEWVPSMRNHLSMREQAHLVLFGAIRMLSAERIKWPLRRKPEGLWPDHKAADRARVGSLLILSRENVEEPRLERVREVNALVERLIRLNFHEARHTIEMTSAFHPAKGWVDAWEVNERRVLTKALHETPVYQLILPRATGRETASKLQEIVTATDDSRIFT